MSLLGPCLGCAAKDKQIEFMQRVIETQQKLNAELASPLVNARIARAEAERNPPQREDRRPMPRASAQLLRGQFPDKPEGPPPELPQDVEASFRGK